MSKERIINYVDMSFRILQDCTECTLKYLKDAKEICTGEEYQRTLEFAANMTSADVKRIMRERDEVREFLQKALPSDPDEPDLVTEANKIDES